MKVKLQSFVEDASVLKVCKLSTDYSIKFCKCSRKKLLPNVHQKMFFDIWLFIHLLFNKRTVPLRENHASVITLLMVNIVWTILIPQNYIDFHSWENRTYTRKLLLNLIQTSKNNK